ncbi:3-methyladenine DNA glycosylase AlkD [Hydrogenispora ethanolica]|uniref:3-methyladenine DNA glycosylase AlkD n=1 Tax=Hydrogenispora ethanolica TaxID=1082276 RepID=A0A4R1RY74_HYDET|nr:DNA alkylation repair protein [Hydrogenispora ethanolica]TCL70932.1 3-methyladenine DNA glycosylase AlkD [Hydrogenispora ethanolica]
MARARMGLDEVLKNLKVAAVPRAEEGVRAGLTTRSAYGVSIPTLRKLARAIGRNHLLAQRLWEIEIRETRLLAGMIADPDQVTVELMEKWLAAVADQELCDQTCMNLFEKTCLAYSKAVEWSSRPEEFVKRAGFVMMARLAMNGRQMVDAHFLAFLPLIEKEATDNRLAVRKALSWALRKIGKRNEYLNEQAIVVALRLKQMENQSARWIAGDALRELQGAAVLERLGSRGLVS